MHPDTCDDCGHKVQLEAPRLPRQPILCEDCWRAQEYDPTTDL